MPSKSKAQHALMVMCAHAESRGRVRGKCPPMKVAKEFANADRGRHFKNKHVKKKKK